MNIWIVRIWMTVLLLALLSCSPAKSSDSERSNKKKTSGKSSSEIYRNGNQVGNGGDALVCGSDIDLLDYHEAVHRWNLEIDLGDETLSVDDKVVNAIKRLEVLDPYRANELLELARQFASSTRYLDGERLLDVPDSNHISLPDGCDLRQVAVQKEPRVADDPYYFVANDLFQQLSQDHQAGLILHEIIYRSFVPFQVHESTLVRYFNVLLASGKIERLTREEYLEIIDDLSFAPHEIPLFTNSIEFNDDGSYSGLLLNDHAIKSMNSDLVLGANRKVTIRANGTIESGLFVQFDPVDYRLSDDCSLTIETGAYESRTYFYESGEVWKSSFDHTTHYLHIDNDINDISRLCIPGADGALEILGWPEGGGGYEVALHRSGVLMELVLANREETAQRLFVHEFETAPFCHLSKAAFWSNGFVKEGTICPHDEGVDLMTSTGTRQSYTTRTQLTFDEQGRVTSQAQENEQP